MRDRFGCEGCPLLLHNFQEALRQLDVPPLVAVDVLELGQGAGVRDLGQKLCVGFFRLLLLAQEGVELFGQLLVFKLKHLFCLAGLRSGRPSRGAHWCRS